MTSSLSWRSIGVAAVLGWWLAACAGGPAPQDHFYRLEAGAPQTAAGAPILDGALVVERPETDALTRGRAIVHRASSGDVEVTPYAYHLWVDTPDLLVQRSLVDYLTAAGVAAEVTAPQLDVPRAWTLETTLKRFEHVRSGSGSVVVEMGVRVSDSRRRRSLLRRTYLVERPAGGGPDDAAPAFGAALGEVFARLVADLEAARGSAGAAAATQ